MATTVDELLAGLADDASFRADWDEVLRRANLADMPAARGRRLRPFKVAIAALAAVIIVGSALAAAGIGPFDVRSWLSGTPGKPASEGAQRLFKAANGHTWAAFPTSTKLRELVSADFSGQRFTLYGFRSGNSVCLTLKAVSLRSSLPPACAPVSAVERLSAPIVSVGVNRTVLAFPERRSPQVSFGIAADQVLGVTIVAPDGSHAARLGGNAYLWADPDPTTANPVTSIAARLRGGTVTIAPPSLNWMSVSLVPQTAAGPTKVTAPIRHPKIAWLLHGEKRGLSLEQARLKHFGQLRRGQADGAFRFFKPDPTSDIVVGISPGCIYLDDGVACSSPNDMFSRGPLNAMITAANETNSSDAFLNVGGAAADGVAAIRAFLPNGSSERLALTDNVFAGVIPNLPPVRLVAYDAKGRIAGVETMLSFARTAPTKARRFTAFMSLRGAHGVRASLALGPMVSYVRCWRLATSAGAHQGGCETQSITGPALTIVGVQPSGGALFVFGTIRESVASVSIRFDDGRETRARVTAGWFLVAIPARELSHTRRHAVVIGRESSGAVAQMPALFYRATG
jgi:hypothetical protein